MPTILQIFITVFIIFPCALSLQIITKQINRLHNSKPNHNSPILRPSHRKTALKDSVPGLNAETLNALDNVKDVSDSLDLIPDSSPVVNILTNAVSSPLILAIPITAGFLLAFGIGYFIFWYGRGGE